MHKNQELNTFAFLNNYPLYKHSGLSYGMATALDIYGSVRRYSLNDIQESNDLDAIRSDWQAIGFDFYNSIETHKINNVENASK